MIVFDIETGPLDEEAILNITGPFQEPSPPGKFIPEDVKLGNLKDKDKIAAKVGEARAKHAAAVANHKAKVEADRSVFIAGAINIAPLNALTGQILAIGYNSTSKKKVIVDDVRKNKRGEVGVLERFWETYKKCRQQSENLVGHNIFGFDLPFLFRRSVIHGLDIPPEFIERGRFIENRTFVCTMQRWALGSTRDWVGLDALATALGFAGKVKDDEFEVAGQMLELCGENFWRFYEDTEENRLRATGYLRGDLIATQDVAERMGIL